MVAWEPAGDSTVNPLVSPESLGEVIVTVEAGPATLIKLVAPSLRSAVVTVTLPELPEICTFPTATEPADVGPGPVPGCASMLILLLLVVRLTGRAPAVVGCRFTFPPVLLGPLM